MMKHYPVLLILCALCFCGALSATDILNTETPITWGVLGRSNKYLKEERAAGIQIKLLEFFWKEYFPQQGVKNHEYVQKQRKRIAQLKEHGFKIALNIGANDVPEWIHENYNNTYYVNQF